MKEKTTVFSNFINAFLLFYGEVDTLTMINEVNK